MKLIKECKETYKISENTDVMKFLKEFAKEKKEYLIVIGLSSKNMVIYREIVTIGILDSCLWHPREVFKNAIIRSAASIIVAHNHPSGDLEPSKEDLKMDKRLKECGELLHIKVIDNVIFNTKECKSIKSANLSEVYNEF